MDATSTLLIIDVQNDFCPGGSLAVNKGDDVVPVINRIVESFSVVTATQDWHPATHKSFASQHKNLKPYDVVELNGIEQVLWPDHCIQESKGAEFHKDLNLETTQLVVRKGFRENIDSYSAFFENDKTTDTGLHEYYQELDITTVYIAGLATDYCVYYSAMDALKLGYKTYIIEDACRGIDFPEGNVENVLQKFQEAGGSVIQSNRIKQTQ